MRFNKPKNPKKYLDTDYTDFTDKILFILCILCFLMTNSFADTILFKYRTGNIEIIVRSIEPNEPNIPPEPNEPAGFQIQPGHPLVVGLAFCSLINKNKPVELVTGINPDVNNVFLVSTPYGAGIKCVTGQTNLEWNREFIKTSDGLGTGDFTMAILANPAATADDTEHLFVQKNDAGGSPYGQACLSANANEWNNHVDGSFTFYTYHSDLGSRGIAVAGMCDGNWHLFAGVRSGTTLLLYRDGVLVGSEDKNFAVDITNAPNSRYTALGSRGNGMTQSYSKSIAIAWSWDRVLSPAEIVPLYNKPFDMFDPNESGTSNDYVWPKFDVQWPIFYKDNKIYYQRMGKSLTTRGSKAVIYAVEK
jgi:hypothetical protein